MSKTGIFPMRTFSIRDILHISELNSYDLFGHFIHTHAFQHEPYRPLFSCFSLPWLPLSPIHNTLGMAPPTGAATLASPLALLHAHSTSLANGEPTSPTCAHSTRSHEHTRTPPTLPSASSMKVGPDGNFSRNGQPSMPTASCKEAEGSQQSPRSSHPPRQARSR